MQITARLDTATIEGLLHQLLPATVIIDEDGGVDRWIRIDRARSVAFVEGEGLLVEVGGHIHWKAAGVPVPLTINSAHLMVRPVVVDDDNDAARLVFRPSLEKMDISFLPGFVDNSIAARVNKRLEDQGDKLAWHVGRTLKNEFPLAEEFIDVDTFHIAAGKAAVEVGTDAIVFTLRLVAGFTRVSEPPAATT